MILYTAIQQLENHLLVPKVMGGAVDLHPAVIIMSLVVGGALFGSAGPSWRRRWWPSGATCTATRSSACMATIPMPPS